jgi:hypothetical protein
VWSDDLRTLFFCLLFQSFFNVIMTLYIKCFAPSRQVCDLAHSGVGQEP